MSKVAKIEDVATEAGVSIMTVSRALRGVEGVSDAKRTEIISTAKRLGYVPNRNAQSLAIANSNLIGISVPTLFDQVFADIFDGIRFSLEHAGYEAMVSASDYSEAREENWLKRMLSWKPAALMITGQHHSTKTRTMLRDSRIPVMEIWDYSDDPIDCCVGIDHVNAGRLAANFLIEKGYKNPAIGGVTENTDPRSEARFDGFKAVFQETHLTEVLDFRAPQTASFEAGKDVMAQIATQKDRPDCCFFLNDHLAFGALCHCRSIGLRVPEDFAIMGFNGLGLNDVLNQTITTIKTPRGVMGTTAIRNLLARIHGAKVDRAVSMPVTLQHGKTTR